MTPGIQNRLLADPAVVSRLLESDRAAEIIGHAPVSPERNIDWVAQVALNDPAGVVGVLSQLAQRYPVVDAALDRLVAGRPPALTEEQVVDVFLSLAEFERRQFWTNPRIRDAFLDFLCQDRNVAEFRAQIGKKLDMVEVTSHLRVSVGEVGPVKPITHPVDYAELPLAEPVAADILVSLDADQLDQLWNLGSFRSSFVENLLAEEDLFQLRTLLRSKRFVDPTARQAIFDAAAGAQPLQISTVSGETVILPSADLGFSKAFWSDRAAQLLHLERYLALRKDAGRGLTDVFVDVGANIGTHTIRALRSGQFEKAVVIEPDQRLLPILRANLVINGLESRVTVVECAAGATETEVSFWRSGINWGDNRLISSEPESHEVGEWTEVVVPVRTVDAIIRDVGLEATEVGVLWIDVQGQEVNVLAGASEAIHGGCDVVAEFWPSVLDDNGLSSATLDALTAITPTWTNLKDGQQVSRSQLEAIYQEGVRCGEHYDTDLAYIARLTHDAEGNEN
jgi:FkbM family methyltransferase